MEVGMKTKRKREKKHLELLVDARCRLNGLKVPKKLTQSQVFAQVTSAPWKDLKKHFKVQEQHADQVEARWSARQERVRMLSNKLSRTIQVVFDLDSDVIKRQSESLELAESAHTAVAETGVLDEKRKKELANLLTSVEDKATLEHLLFVANGDTNELKKNIKNLRDAVASLGTEPDLDDDLRKKWTDLKTAVNNFLDKLNEFKVEFSRVSQEITHDLREINLYVDAVDYFNGEVTRNEGEEKEFLEDLIPLLERDIKTPKAVVPRMAITLKDFTACLSATINASLVINRWRREKTEIFGLSYSLAIAVLPVVGVVAVASLLQLCRWSENTQMSMIAVQAFFVCVTHVMMGVICAFEVMNPR